MTVKANFKFTVKEHASGEPWICLEPLDGELKGEGLPSGFFGLTLAQGASLENAREVASYLNRNIEQLTFTRL